MATVQRLGGQTGGQPSGYNNDDNSGRNQTYDFKTYTQVAGVPAAIALIPTEGDTTVVVNLTGALALTTGVGTSTTPPYVGDRMKCIFLPDGTNRTVTPGSGFTLTASTIVCTASKRASIDFVFNGTDWQETARSITV